MGSRAGDFFFTKVFRRKKSENTIAQDRNKDTLTEKQGNIHHFARV